MADLGLVSKSVSDILGFQGEAAVDTAGATAQGFAQQGDLAESRAYGSAASIANQNAALAAVAGQIRQYQQQRNVAQVTGAEQADVGSAGFRNSGSSLLALKSSFQQGYLADQLIRTQTGMTQGGFLEQGTAATGEQQATNFAAQGAGALQTEFSTAAGTATTNAANETAALAGFIKNSGTKVTIAPGGPLPAGTTTVGGIAGTPEGALVTSTLAGASSGLPASWSGAASSGMGLESSATGGAGLESSRTSGVVVA